MRNQNKIRIVTTLLLIVLSGIVKGQDSVLNELSLDEAIEQTIVNNRQIKSAKLEIEAAQTMWIK